MSLFDRLFGRRSVDKIIKGIRHDEYVTVEVPDTPCHRVHDLPLHIHQIPPMGEQRPDGVNVMVTTYADADIKPYRTCVIIGTGGPVARCQAERERDIYHNLMVEVFATCPPDDKQDKLCEKTHAAHSSVKDKPVLCSHCWRDWVSEHARKEMDG